MRSIFTGLLILLINLSIKSQTLNPYYYQIVENASYTDYYNNLQDFEDFGAKDIGSQGLINTANWIISYYEDLGYTDIEIDTFDYYGDEVYNMIITKEGSEFPGTYFIIDGHYDTVGNSGTDDNGSGTVCVMEAAKLLKDVQTKISIKFIHFTAEEVGLVGSSYYVDNTVIPENMDIKLLLNIDMIGGDGSMTNDIIKCERDQDGQMGNDELSALYTDTLASLTELYTELGTTITHAYASDYIPFAQNGEIITGFFEYHMNPFYHTINDLLINMDPEYAFQTAKAATAATLYFSEAYETVGILENQDRKITAFPNPFYETVYFQVDKKYKLTVKDITGRIVLQNIDISEGTNEVNLSHLNNSIYLFQLSDNTNNIIKTGKLVKQ